MPSMKLPPQIIGSISYKEQCQLYTWLKAQIAERCPEEVFMPSAKEVSKWDDVKSKQLTQLSKHLYKACKAKGEKPVGARACLVEAWGFLVRPRSKADYTVDRLRKDVAACNKYVYAQLPQPCDEVNLDTVIIFSHPGGIKWNKLPENRKAVLSYALGSLGPGLSGVAEQLGMQLGSVKEGRLQLNLTQPGQGSYNEQLKRLLMATIAANRLPRQEMPAYSTLFKINPTLADAVKHYKSKERDQLKDHCNQEGLGRAVVQNQLTGARMMANELGLDAAVHVNGCYPHGHWQVTIWLLLNACAAAVLWLVLRAWYMFLLHSNVCARLCCSICSHMHFKHLLSGCFKLGTLVLQSSGQDGPLVIEVFVFEPHPICSLMHQSANLANPGHLQ